MLAEAVLPLLLAVSPVTPAVSPVTPAVSPVTPAVSPVTPAVSPVVIDLSDDDIRSAIAIAAGPEARRRAFLGRYVAHYGYAGTEQITRVELVTPFREVVERAIREIRVNNSYSERRARDELRQTPPALRVVVHIRLPLGAIPLDNAVPFGQAYRVTLSYRTERGEQAVVPNPQVTVTTLCQGLPCILPNPGLDGAILETSSPLPASGEQRVDLRRLFSVIVKGPAGRMRIAHFDLAGLR